MEMANSELLTTGDFCMIALYLVVVVTIGILAGRGQKTSEDYFVAGRQMHWFPLALSIWASLTSANSMLGAPSYGYSQDLQYIVPGIITSILGAALTIGYILPLLQPLKLTTSYTYLEQRFGIGVRCLGSILFILLRGGWLASVIYAPSLALSAVIPIPAIDQWLGPLGFWCGISGSTFFWIVVVGSGATAYTTLGGLRAVIWTDVVQFFVFVVGMLAIWFLLARDIGISNMFQQLAKVPRAHVENDFQVGWGETVRLDGSQSVAFDGSTLTYAWQQRRASEEVPEIELPNKSGETLQFIAPPRSTEGAPVTLPIELRVTTNGTPPLQSAPAVVHITVTDNPDLHRSATPPAFHERPHDTWFDFRFKLFFGTGVTFWSLFVTGLLARLNDGGTDQVTLQRYFSARSIVESRRAIWISAICDVPLMPLMYLTGAGVLVYYAIHHYTGLPATAGQTMPYFVAHKLNQVVPGLAGLFIAALFAATMSSVDSGINSISATLTTDWYRRLLVRNRDERHYLRIARILTLVLGILATSVALLLGQIGELWQISIALMGFWTGPLLGVFLLGFFTCRANTVGVLSGSVAGLACTVWFQQTGGNEFLFSVVGLLPTLIVGYVVSLVTGAADKSRLHGLTLWTKHLPAENQK